VNLSLNFLKRSERQKKYREYYINNSQESRERENDLVNNIDSPEDVSAAEQLKASLEKAFDELPIIYKATFSLVVYEGMSHREAAEVLGCSEGTVSWRIHQARRMIKEKLQPYFGQKKET
jgi:RNA polymerase sigma-70 factor (ECF subfamily)